MIVNAGIANTAVFTCSICSEPSSNICAYCTKDACANHRCERCKRCSDCCECDMPLSAEEPLPAEAIASEAIVPEAIVPEAIAEPASQPDAESPEPEAQPFSYPFLTREEASVFAEETEPITPPYRPADPTDEGA